MGPSVCCWPAYILVLASIHSGVWSVVVRDRERKSNIINAIWGDFDTKEKGNNNKKSCIQANDQG